jgi:hypothetical protein
MQGKGGRFNLSIAARQAAFCVPVSTPTSKEEAPQFLQHLIFNIVLILVSLLGCTVFHCAFKFISLTATGAGYFFIEFLALWPPSFILVPIQLFFQFSTGLLSPLVYESSFYVLDFNALSCLYFTNIFSETCPFTF